MRREEEEEEDTSEIAAKGGFVAILSCFCFLTYTTCHLYASDGPLCSELLQMAISECISRQQ